MNFREELCKFDGKPVCTSSCIDGESNPAEILKIFNNRYEGIIDDSSCQSHTPSLNCFRTMFHRLPTNSKSLTIGIEVQTELYMHQQCSKKVQQSFKIVQQLPMNDNCTKRFDNLILERTNVIGLPTLQQKII